MNPSQVPPPFCWVDGRPRVAPSRATMPLSEWLREEEGAHGVQRGCDSGHCGSCAVQVDGMAIKSCTLAASEAAGSRVLTVSALAQEGSAIARAVVLAMREPAVLQCGFCESAFVFAAIELLTHESDPDEQAVRQAFDGLLCRCTGYQRLIEAVLAAARALRAPGQDAHSLRAATSTPEVHAAALPEPVARLPAPIASEDARRLQADRPRLRWLAGGQQVMPDRALDDGDTEWASLRRINDLCRIELRGDTLVVGAACTHHDIARAPLIRRHLPALSALAARIGDAFVRNRGTLGGALFDPTPGACYPAALIALGARVETSHGRIDAATWFSSPQPSTLVESVHIPLADSATHQCLRPVPGRYALVSLFACVRAGQVRVGVSGQGLAPYRAHAAEASLVRDPEQRTLTVAWDREAFSDFRAPADYRNAIAAVLLERARAAFLASATVDVFFQPSS